jgi:hypothetical protein
LLLLRKVLSPNNVLCERVTWWHVPLLSQTGDTCPFHYHTSVYVLTVWTIKAGLDRSYIIYFNKNIDEYWKLDFKVYSFFRHEVIFVLYSVTVFCSHARNFHKYTEFMYSNTIFTWTDDENLSIICCLEMGDVVAP